MFGYFKKLMLVLLMIAAPCFVPDMGANRSFSGLMIDDNVSLQSRFVELSFSAFGFSTLSSDMMRYHFHLPGATPSLQISELGSLSKGRMMSFLWNNNKRLDILRVEKLVDLYINESAAEAVNHDIAFLQMCHETGFLRFTGDVNEWQHNYCGLGATGNGVPGLSFPTMKAGVRAHVQHLKAYASTDRINGEAVYERIRFVKRGIAPTLHDLTGKWATDPLYGKKIERLISQAHNGSFLGIRVNRDTLQAKQNDQ